MIWHRKYIKIKDGLNAYGLLQYMDTWFAAIKGYNEKWCLMFANNIGIKL